MEDGDAGDRETSKAEIGISGGSREAEGICVDTCVRMVVAVFRWERWWCYRNYLAGLVRVPCGCRCVRCAHCRPADENGTPSNAYYWFRLERCCHARCRPHSTDQCPT